MNGYTREQQDPRAYAARLTCLDVAQGVIVPPEGRSVYRGCRYGAVAFGVVNWIEPLPLVVPVNNVFSPVDTLPEPLIWLTVPMKLRSLFTFAKIEFDIDNIDELIMTRPSPVIFVKRI